ncbi:DUF5309 domain-containing protein [Pectinatus frisingensis]|uniref:DUF5309 domain-containing protein n=1 Tax=Pectinatus frisingensis TaxID=865 RepID=UPI0018C632DB|nr:DUF5309 domain-containing protein [Pectinatus frisingensis]
MTTYKNSYDEPTNREDLTDVITNISPDDTPITTMIGKSKAKATYHEWPVDSLAAAKANAYLEGSGDTVSAAPARVRKGNYTQIMKQGYGVSETQQAVDTAGVSNEYDYNMMKAMKEIGKDLEYAITMNAAKVQGSDTVARQMGGIPAMVTTNTLANGGTARFITNAILTSAAQKIWDAGGKASKVIVSSSNKVIISALTTSNTKNVEAAKKQITEAIDVIDTDFGRLEIVSSHYMPDTEIFVLDPRYLAVAWLRPFKKKDLPSTDDAESGIIKGEMTLEVKAEKAQAIISDLKVA